MTSFDTGGNAPVVRWSLIKYQPDVRRGEPRNIGVVVQAGQEVGMRFVGETAPGEVDRRRARPYVDSTENFARWISYFRRSAANERLGDVLAHWRERRTESNYYVGDPATIFGDQRPVATIADALFSTLVGKPEAVAITEEDEPDGISVSELFELLDVTPVADPHRDVLIHQEAVPISFDYGYQNGVFHLLEELPLASGSKTMRRAARDFLYRAQWAREVGWSDSFVVFHTQPLRKADRETEAAIHTINREAYSVDLSNVDQAVEETKTILGIR